jgi:DNA-binding transcriptional MerR regulator
VSAQSVRKYEDLGFLPPAQRSASGHRRYGQRHLEAILAARAMQAGYGWLPALHIMQCVHQGDLAAALELIDARHAEVHAGRREVEDTLTALRDTLATEQPFHPGSGAHEPLRVGDVARLVGVRVSALRFWEQVGLLQPRRDPASGYRLYDREQIRRLRIIVLLRRAGYRPERIATVLAAIGTGNPQSALAAIERRSAELAERSRRCAAATAAFWGYVCSVGMEDSQLADSYSWP